MGVIMKKYFENSGKYLVTLLAVIVAAGAAWHLWDYYMREPWTRDARLRADIVGLAPDVSGLVTEVNVGDNAHVKKGEVLFRIDTARYTLAVSQAKAELASDEAALRQSQRDLARYAKLAASQTVSHQKREQAETSVAQAEAARQKAEADLSLARLNLERSVVRSPVNGIVTNFSLRPGDYVSAGKAVTALVDEDSFYVAGYFEETKLQRIEPGAPVRIALMGSSEELTGQVESIASGIADRERSDAAGLLPDVEPTFNWVRLAQRVPVRIALRDVPRDVHLVAGRTATVTVLPISSAAHRS